MLNYLANYTVEHFQTEEKHMVANKYPKYDEHKAIHDAFVGEVTHLIDDFNTRSAKVDLVINLNGKVVKWLISHIMGTDKELGTFLKSSK